MSLKEWERKFNLLNEELDVLIEKIGQESFDHLEKKLAKLKETLPNLEGRLSKNLSYISSQVSRNRFYSEKEKAAIHWAKKFAHDTHNFYKEYAQIYNQVFWAKLVNLRNDCVVSHGEGSFFIKKKSPKHEVPKKQKRLLETRDRLKKKLKNLAKKSVNLEDRYHRLATNKTNRESLSTSFDSLKNQEVDWQARETDMNSMKLGYLVTQPSVGPSRNKKKSSFRVDYKDNHPIRSFDYLRLEDL